MALPKETIDKYLPTIGIECHVQLKTKTKLFAAVGNDARDALPNTLISHICVGMPGALPVLNQAAVDLAAKAAFALKTRPQPHSVFERKHYFYPDLPMGYQISQLNDPIIVGGHVTIEVDGEQKDIGIERAQLEADAGKNTHPEGADYSLVDLNRAGTPLLEIVSKPDIHSAVEARAYVRELFLLMKYSGVSDCDLYHGNMRFDVNVSVSTNPTELGTRAEVKNLNSFKSVEASIEYEITRQIELLEKGTPIVQETRGWDDAKQKTLAQRGKEEAHDYRYFPDPDIPPVELDNAYIASIENSVSKLPYDWRTQLRDVGLDHNLVETLLDVEVEDESVTYLSEIEKVISNPEQAKVYALWIVNYIVPAERDGKLAASQQRSGILASVYELVKDGRLSSNSVKALLILMLANDHLPPDVAKYAEQQGLIQESDEGALSAIVKDVLANNPKAVEDVRSGQEKVIGFLVGQVMKQSLGKANPAIAQEIIKKQIGI